MHGPQVTHPRIRWTLRDVLIAGRRLSGTASGRDPHEALRHFVARQARDLRVDISAAIGSAERDPYKKIEPRGDEP